LQNVRNADGLTNNGDGL